MSTEGTLGEEKNRRMRLWRLADKVADFELDSETKEEIWRDFVRKVESQRTGRSSAAAVGEDAFMKKHYQAPPLDPLNKKDNREFYESAKCEKLREQSMLLLNIARKEISQISELIELYGAEEDVRQATCIRKIVKKKKQKVMYIEAIRGYIAEIIASGEEAVAFLDRCVSILNFYKETAENDT